MQPAKKLRGRRASASKASASRETAAAAAAVPADVDDQTEFAQVAKQHWLKTTKRTTKVKVKNTVVKGEIWDVLEKEGFPLRSLIALESLQALERYAPFLAALCPPRGR